MNIARQSIKIVECTISSEQNVSKTLISLARILCVKYGRFRLLSGRREIEAEIRELPENTGDLATLLICKVVFMLFYLNKVIFAVLDVPSLPLQ